MVNRLSPAPPPIINAWSMNQLIENIPNRTTDQEIPQVSTSPPISQEYSLSEFESTPHSAPPITKRKSNKNNTGGSVMIKIGKNTTIKKPTRSQNKGNIKGGTGFYKYRIRNDYHINQVLPIDTNQEELQQEEAISPIEIQFPSLISDNFPLGYPPIPISPPPPPPAFTMFPVYPIYEYYTPTEFSQPIQSPKSSKHDIIKRQLEYYFSTENLCKDLYLRSLFDPIDGSVKLEDLIQFNRLKKLTKNGTNLHLLIDVISEIENLQLLENQNKVRIKNWKDWVN